MGHGRARNNIDRMKKLMVANIQKSSKCSIEDLTTLLKLQIENSLNIGWDVNNIILLSNFDFEFMEVKAIKVVLNDFCLTGSKIFGTKFVFDNKLADIIYAADLDCFQDIWFNCPEFKDVGVTQYSRPKINGGVIFWKNSAIDIIGQIVNALVSNKEKREEPTLNKILKLYEDRVTVLESGFNLGCSGYILRFMRSEKPVKSYHFHPSNRIAWETHVLDRNGIGSKISERLECLIRKYYPNLATELSDKGKERRAQHIKERQNGNKKYEKGTRDFNCSR